MLVGPDKSKPEVSEVLGAARNACDYCLVKISSMSTVGSSDPHLALVVNATFFVFFLSCGVGQPPRSSCEWHPPSWVKGV